MFIKELARIRECGYAIDNEENEIGVRCVAAAITDDHEKPKYAFSVSAPSNRMTDENIIRIAANVLQIKNEILKHVFGKK